MTTGGGEEGKGEWGVEADGGWGAEVGRVGGGPFARLRWGDSLSGFHSIRPSPGNVDSSDGSGGSTPAGGEKRLPRSARAERSWPHSFLGLAPGVVRVRVRLERRGEREREQDRERERKQAS